MCFFLHSHCFHCLHHVWSTACDNGVCCLFLRSRGAGGTQHRMQTHGGRIAASSCPHGLLSAVWGHWLVHRNICRGTAREVPPVVHGQPHLTSGNSKEGRQKKPERPIKNPPGKNPDAIARIGCKIANNSLFFELPELLVRVALRARELVGDLRQPWVINRTAPANWAGYNFNFLCGSWRVVCNMTLMARGARGAWLGISTCFTGACGCPAASLPGGAR